MQDTNNIDTIIANLHIVREQAKELEHEVDQLEGRLRVARGTGDVTKEAAQATATTVAAAAIPAMIAVTQRIPVAQLHIPRPQTQVERAIRGQSLNVAQISKATGLAAGKVSDRIKQLRQDRRVANTGSEDFPRWTLRIGDSTSTQQLTAEVKRLVIERPMTTQELVEITGARMSRVSGSLIHLQRTEDRLLNLGTARRAKWFLVSAGVTMAKLAPKASNA